MRNTATVELSNGAEVEVEYSIEKGQKGDHNTEPISDYIIWYSVFVRLPKGELMEIPDFVLKGLKLEEEITEIMNNKLEDGEL